MKIQTKIFVTILFSSVCLLFLASLFFYLNQKKTLKQQVFNQLKSIASLQSARLDSIIEQNIERLQLVSSRTQLRLSLERYLVDGEKEPQEKMIRILHDAKSSIPSFKSISIISLDGSIAASTASYPSINSSPFDNGFFVRSQNERSADTLFLDAKDNQVLLLGGPLHLNGKLLGVLVIESAVNNILSSVKNYSGLGESGEIIITRINNNGDAHFLFPTRFDDKAALKRIISKETPNCPLQQLTSKNTSLLSMGLDYRGQTVLCVANYIGKANWVVFAKLDYSEALQGSNRTRDLLIIVAIALTFVAMLISFVFARNITKPILHLTKSMKKVSDGDLSIIIKKISTDEIGTLSKSFNEMIQKRKQAEEELRASDKKLHTLLNVTTDIAFLIDSTGILLEINDALAKSLGKEKEELIGKKVFDFLPEEIAKSRMFKLQKIVEFEEALQWVDRREGRFFFNSAYPIFDKNRNVEQIAVFAVDITSQKQVKEALQNSESQLRQIIDLVPHFIFVKDDTGKFEIVNKATAEVFGTTVEDLTGRRDTEFVATEEEMEHFRADDLEVIHSGKTKFIPEELITDSEGNTRYLQTTKVPFKFSAHKRPSLLGISVDITWRLEEGKKKEHLLYLMNERMKELGCLYAIAESIRKKVTLEEVYQDVVMLIPPAWQYSNITCARISIGDQEWVSQPARKSPWVQTSNIVVQGKIRGAVEVYYLEQRSEAAEGPFLIEERDLINAIASSLSEAIEYNIVETSQKRLSQAIEQASESVIITDNEGNIEYVNPAFEKLSGYSSQESLGQNPRFLNSGTHDHIFYKELWSTILQGDTWSGRLINKKKDNSLYEEDATISPVLDNTNKISHFLAVKRDVSKEVLLESQLNIALQESNLKLEELVGKRTEELLQAKKDAVAANQAKSRFLANMSHELRTPLNGILGYSQILKRRASPDTDIDGLDVIQNSAEHLLTLINDILDLAKVEAGKLELNPTECRLPLFLQSISELIRVQAEDKNILLSFEPHPSLPEGVMVDEKCLRQVLLNLLGNALKFTEYGEIRFGVEVLASGTEQKVNLRFTVEDSGIGINPKQLDKIFLPFEQIAKAYDQIEGTGLGLSISRQIIQMMHSELHVKSPLPISSAERRSGDGSIFWFDLSVPVVDIPHRVLSPSGSDIIGYKGDRKIILVVDDQLYNSMLLNDFLVALGFTVVIANDGQQAMVDTLEYHPDLILMDLVMPGMSGLEVTKNIRELNDSAINSTPIIAVSANVLETSRQKCLESGCQAFLEKPVDLQKLLDLVKSHLQLEWVHRKNRSIIDEQNIAKTDDDVIPPPPEELETLLELAMFGNMQKIVTWTEHITVKDGKYAPFAYRIRDLAKSYEDREILTMVKHYLARE